MNTNTTTYPINYLSADPFREMNVRARIGKETPEEREKYLPRGPEILARLEVEEVVPVEAGAVGCPF